MVLARRDVNSLWVLNAPRVKEMQQMSSAQRMSIQDIDPKAYPAVIGLQKYVNSGGLDKRLTALVDIRASQINGCAWCLDMHAAEAREAGATQRQIDLVAAWSEAGALFSEREQAALAFTEQVTLISEHGVTDDVWERVNAVFSEQEIVTLLMAIAAINVWNRMNVTVRTALPDSGS
jgi:AhpD family alkylhydroperoxidase